MISAAALKSRCDTHADPGDWSTLLKSGTHIAGVSIGRDLVFASGAGFLTPGLKLLVSGWNLSGAEIYTNYEPTETERNTVALRNAGIDQASEGAAGTRTKIRMDLAALGRLDGGYYHRIEPGYGGGQPSAFQRLFATEFPLPDGPGPNIDLQREHDVAENKTGNGIHTVHRVYLAAAYAILGKTATKGQRNAVACLVVDSSGRIISWGQKSSGYPTLHAETSALLRHGAPLPRGARIYTTLSPCKMCGSWIKSCCTEDQVVAYYGTYDRTGLAGATALGANARGVRQLQAYLAPKPTGPKPLDLDKDGRTGPSMRNKDLPERLIATRNESGSVGIVEHLSDDARVKQMRETSAAFFQGKRKKYQSEKPPEGKILNQNVQRVLEHVQAFLVRNGVGG